MSRDEFEELWNDREEYLQVLEQRDPFCICEDFGEDACPIHSQDDLEVIDDIYVEELTITTEDKEIHNKRKKTTQR